MNLENFTKICALFAKIDLYGSGPPAVPWRARGVPTADDIVKTVSSAANLLPRVYREGYADKLVHEAPSIVAQYDDRFSPGIVEALTGAVYDHNPENGVRPELRRFLAVVSDLYTSFLSNQRRAALALPLVGQLPPLVMFQSRGTAGPFTIAADSVLRLIGSDIGVVSLPSTYRSHPVLWGSLAHETGGHDVTHADPGLLDELADQIMHVFGGPTRWSPTPSPPQLRALVWAYWIDQAAADIYGVLNAGPAFMMNLAAFFSALIKRAAPSSPIPYLRSRSGADEAGDLDPHPTDILRIHLAIGVIDSLRGLSSDVRARYIADLEQLSKLCAQGATEITLEGAIPFRDTTIRVRTTVPLTEWQEAAREVGQVTADTRMRALNGHGIQDIDTWDDVDEAHAQSIRQGLKENRSVVHFGNDAQLLSGAMLALLDEPGLYETVTARVNEALDESYRTDDVWGAVRRDRVYIGAPLVGEAPRAAGVGRTPVTSLGSRRRTAGARGAASRERR